MVINYNTSLEGWEELAKNIMARGGEDTMGQLSN